MSGLFCTQEEADTRLLFHASHSFHHGYNKVMVHATDTDVVVIAVAVSRIFQNCEVWGAFGYGNKLRYIPCHLIANALGTDASCGLLFFHAVSGCDTVSAFHRVGKKTAWAIWRSMPQLDQIFARLSHAPKQIFPEDLKQLERFVLSCTLGILNDFIIPHPCTPNSSLSHCTCDFVQVYIVLWPHWPHCPHLSHWSHWPPDITGFSDFLTSLASLASLASLVSPVSLV